MILDFLLRREKCYYCKKKIRSKAAIEIIIVVQKKIKGKHRICYECACLIQSFNKIFKNMKKEEQRKKHD